jgi:hypothetical protein
MFGLFLRGLFVASLGIVLAGCGTRPKPVPDVQQVYEIRNVAVTANAGISRALIRGIKLRMDKAIADTVRPAPLPRAVMNINIVDVSRLQGLDGTRTETEISVALTDVPSGQALLVRNFLVYSFSINRGDADESAAEAISSRLRVEYMLTQPVIRKAPIVAPKFSTRMSDDEDRPAVVKVKKEEKKPIVVPLKTAPVIGADQDPVLNSKTKVTPANQDAKVKADAEKKAADAGPADNAVEDGAKVKVVIKPKAATPAADEPCVETMDKKC